MSQSANVRSVDALKQFKIGMIAFAEDARSALTSVEMEIRRTRGWLERDQLAYWKQQVKRRTEEVSQARADLHRKRLSQTSSNQVNDSDQKEALKLAQRRLIEAEEKVEKVKRWIPVLEQAISEYHAHSQPLGDRLTGSFENSLAVLERMVASLEAYLALAAPTAPRFAPAGGSSSGPSATESPRFAQAGDTAPAASGADGAPSTEPAEGASAPQETQTEGDGAAADRNRGTAQEVST